MAKSIETILKLVKNPHYQLSPEDMKTLEEYRRSGAPVRSDNVFEKHETSDGPSYEVHSSIISNEEYEEQTKDK